MIVDVRAYHVKPGKMLQELDLYDKRGLAPQVRHLGSPLAYLHGELADEAGILVDQRNSLMVPASFAPIERV